jgi:transcriptional regulator with XRE-family HTH domain
MLGLRLREARISRHLSLSEVATRAKISVATLSRIERDKQGLDLSMFMTLTKILKTSPQDLVAAEVGEHEPDALAAQIARLDVRERARLWRELATSRKNGVSSKARLHQMAGEVDELLAQLDFLRSEIENIHRRLKPR